MATLADVAKMAGVSKATASRALSRAELVAPATVERVLDAARRLDFIPSRVARHLAGGRSGIVALVVPTLENPFFAPIIAGAQACAAANGIQLTVAVHALDRPDHEAALEQLARQVDGFLVVAPRGTDARVSRACGLRPTVLVDREIDGIASVVADTGRAFGELAQGLTARGHESIVYIGGPAGSWQDRQRSAAMRAATEGRAGLHVLGPLPSTFAAGVAAADAVVEAGATAVVPYATTIGLGLMFALRARGVSAPGDVLVTGESIIADVLGGESIPAIDVDGEELGRAAMQALIELDVDTSVDDPATLRLHVPVRWPSPPGGAPLSGSAQ